MKGATIAALALAVSFAASASAAERLAADVACEATDQDLVYDCVIMLKGRSSGTPVPDANIVVKADMPKMPMAHNVPPVTATVLDQPGHYRARLRLEMNGEWALTLDVSGPARDRLIEKVQFGESMAGDMDHGEGGTGDKMDMKENKAE